MTLIHDGREEEEEDDGEEEEEEEEEEMLSLAIGVEVEQTGDVGTRLRHLIGVGVAHSDDPLGKAVGREEHGGPCTRRRVEGVQHGPGAVGQDSRKCWGPVP